MEIFKKINKLLNLNYRINLSQDRVRPYKGEVMRLCRDNSKLKSICLWKPLISIDDGLLETINWQKSNNKYFHSKYHV